MPMPVSRNRNLAELAVPEARPATARGQDLERAAVGHRLERVLAEVQEHLQQRLRIAGDLRQLLVGAHAQLDALVDFLLEQLDRLAHDVVEIDLVGAFAARPLGARSRGSA